MKSIKELYRIGIGPSSSHTMGPRNAAILFLNRNLSSGKFQVTLYGSLAATGKGHMTDTAILEVLQPHALVILIWKPDVFLPFHPNGMLFEAFDEKGELIDKWTVFSVGGGALEEEGTSEEMSPELYDMNTMAEIYSWCQRSGKNYWEYVEQCEGAGKFEIMNLDHVDVHLHVIVLGLCFEYDL